jgi:hypothetical protein
MTRDERGEIMSLACWLVCICVPFELMPKSYPPRTLSPNDFAFLAIIPVGACFSVKPGVSPGWLVLYGILGAVPFALELAGNLGVPYQIRPDVFRPGVFFGVYLPALLLILKVVLATVTTGLTARTIKTKRAATRYTPP